MTLERILEPVLNAGDREPFLLERVAVADRDRVVGERLLVDRERPGRADFVLAAVAPADCAAVVVLDAVPTAQVLVESPRFATISSLLPTSGRIAAVHGGDPRMEAQHRPLALADDLLVIGVDEHGDMIRSMLTAGSTTYGT